MSEVPLQTPNRTLQVDWSPPVSSMEEGVPASPDSYERGTPIKAGASEAVSDFAILKPSDASQNPEIVVSVEG